MLRNIISFAAACIFAVSEASLKVRDLVPDFNNVNAVVGTEFKKVSLKDYKDQYLVMLFYSFDFGYVCPTELIAFSEAMPQFRALGVNVLGVSTDSHFTHLAWIKTEVNKGGVGQLNFPLVADISKDLSRNFGVLVTNKDDELYGAALRGLYIIDGAGKLRTAQVNDAPVGKSVDEVLRLVKAFQYTDTHEEVCPANWQPGELTMVPDQIKKVKYFEDKYFNIIITKPGNGEKPKQGSVITAHYTGRFLDGKTFDSSFSRNEPFQFGLGYGMVIKCWEQGFAQLSIGAKAIFNCPPDYAYGQNGYHDIIPKNATLKFEVELINIQ